MSESERDTHPAGEIATRAPQDGTAGGEEIARADENGVAGGEEIARADENRAPAAGNGADPDGHHALGAPARPALPEAEPQPLAPVIPLERRSMLHEEPSAPQKVKIRKLRVFGVLLGLGILAVISTIFGMVMAVTSDLPALEVPAGRNSVLQDRNGKDLRSEEHTSELQSHSDLVCRLLLEKKKKKKVIILHIKKKTNT